MHLHEVPSPRQQPSAIHQSERIWVSNVDGWAASQYLLFVKLHLLIMCDREQNTAIHLQSFGIMLRFISQNFLLFACGANFVNMMQNKKMQNKTSWKKKKTVFLLRDLTNFNENSL